MLKVSLQRFQDLGSEHKREKETFTQELAALQSQYQQRNSTLETQILHLSLEIERLTDSQASEEIRNRYLKKISELEEQLSATQKQLLECVNQCQEEKHAAIQQLNMVYLC